MAGKHYRAGNHLSEPEYLHRARVEPVIAGARVVLALGGAVAVWLDPSTPASSPGITYILFIGYVVYSLLMALAVRDRAWLSPPIQVTLHAVDLVVFSVFVLFTEGATSPFFVYFVFSVVCGALRWESKGAFATAYVSIAVYLLLTVSSDAPAGELDRVVVRSIQLAVLAGLLGYLSGFHPKLQRELVSLASWPRTLPRDFKEVAQEIVEQAEMILPGGDVLLAWEDPDEGHTRLVWRRDALVEWHRDEPGAVDRMILPAMRYEGVQTSDAADPMAQVRLWDGGAITEQRGAVITPAVRERFHVRTLQSCRLHGDPVKGQLFWLNRGFQRSDELVLGSLVARLAASRLDAVYRLRKVEEAAAMKERLNVARDLHDTVLQMLTGTALQLAAVARLFESGQQAAAIERLNIARQHVEFIDLEMRALIRRLRPAPTAAAPRSKSLEERLTNLQRRIEHQWQVKIDLRTSVSQALPERLVQQVAFIVNEAVLNAARHAGASTIRVDVASDDGRTLRLQIADNGSGFPFKGVYDLDALNELGIGPKTVKERVAELGGRLTVSTSDTGTAVVALLPTNEARE